MRCKFVVLDVKHMNKRDLLNDETLHFSQLYSESVKNREIGRVKNRGKWAASIYDLHIRSGLVVLCNGDRC